jgi:prepilin-type processing-associated H-X9-DG protein
MIEMIVVLAICAILAASLMPLLLKARGEARRVVCADNLSRIGIAVNTVLPNKSGYFTNGFYNVTNIQDGTWWVGLRNQWDDTDPMVQADIEGVYSCPSATGFVTLTGADGDGKRVEFATTYAQNVELPIIAANIARVPEPSTRVILYDGDAASVVGRWQHTLNWPEGTINRRHNKMANFLFLDGHVETNGTFRAEPFHGCPMGRTPFEGQGLIEGASETSGPSSWVLLASVDIHPESNNVGNEGNTVQCKITIPAGYGGGWIDTSKLYLVGAAGNSFDTPLPAVEPISQDVNEDGNLICQCKFDRQLLYDELVAGNYFGKDVPMRVVGEFEDGRPFEGVDANCVFDPPSSDPVDPPPDDDKPPNPHKPPKK